MNTQQRAILSKASRLSAMDAEWDESKHPRAENGRFGSGRPSENGRLNLPENPTRGDLRRAAKQWLSENLQGKTVPTSDGKKVTFNRNDSTDHLSFNASRSKLHAQAVTFVADVFQTGRFIGREELAHERKDNFVAFHKYQKQVEIDGYRVLLEAAAGELPNGELEAADEMIAYNQRLAGKEKVGNAPASIETAKDSGQAAGFVSYADNHTPAQNQMQGCEFAAYAYKKIDSKSEKGSQNLHADDAANSIRKLEFGSTAFKVNPTPAADSAQEEKAVNSHSSTDIAADSTRIPDSLFTADINHTPAADSVQLFRILKITDPKGNDVSKTYDETIPEQENKYYTIEAIELNEKSPAAQWVDSTVQADGLDPTSIRSAGDILSLAKTVEQFQHTGRHIKRRSMCCPDLEGLHPSQINSDSTALKGGCPSGRGFSRKGNNMKTRDKNTLAQDRSLRSYDKDGRLHVESSNISKATVNPYYGGEIPNYRQLGLEPKKVYYLLRDPEELEKAAPTFNNLPLLNKHIPVSADEPQKEVIAGTTGSDTVFEDGYLKCSLAVWDAEAIAGIESGEQVELSSAYHYTADMTAGEFEGRHYDGVMRDIVGNHVALVDVGRAGRDVVVSDADPFNKKENTMKLKAGAKARIQAAVQPLLAQDAELSPDELLQVIGSLTNEVQTAQDDGKELPPENVENVGTDEDEPEDGENNTAPAEDEEPEAPEGGAPKPAQDAAISKMAMDAAIQKAVAAERKRAQALAAAQREVAHIVGDVAMDNAADVYKFALEQSGIDVTGVHPSAYRAMVGMLGKPKQPMAQDAAKTAQQFPGLSRIRKA